MTFEINILTVLELYFNIERISSSRDIGVDAILSLKSNSSVCAYIIIEKNVKKDKLDYIIRSINQDQLAKLPTIIFEQDVDTNNITFGLLSYWDFDRCFINKNIKWRELNKPNVNWLTAFLNARRGNIRFLPNHMFRVEKIISLNSSSLIEGEIHYLRKFQGNYRMKKTQMQSNSDNFSQFLYGIPEDEFPSDKLDNFIFNHIKNIYPAAEIKSNLILFETDLLDVARLKDRKIKYETIYAHNLQTDYFRGIATLEMFYNQNIWMTLESVRNILITLDCRDENEIQQLQMWINDVYEPLSEINV